MSTFFVTYPQNVPFPQFSQALQASVYWEPSLSIFVSVLNATSPAIVELQADSVALNEALRAEYEAMRDFFVETLDKFKGTDPAIDDYIARIYTTFLEQPVDTDVYGEPKSWETFNFTGVRPDLILDDVDWFQPLRDSQRENFMPSASSVALTSSNYFYGLASAYNAVLRRVISKRRTDWDLWREVPKLGEMYASIELLRDQFQVRNSLRGENSTEIRQLRDTMRAELSTALLALVTARFDSDLVWSTPSDRHTNHMAQVETTITNPIKADEIASQVELEVDNNNLNILTTLQEDFPDYEIPLEVPTRAYNQTGMVSNLNVSRNGRSNDYPVRDARTGSYLWVQGGPNSTGLKRYGANGPAVDSMEDFMAYTFPQVRLVSEYEEECSLAGRTDLGEFLEYYNRYQVLDSAINTNGIGLEALEGGLTPDEQSFMVDGEFDFEAAQDSLREDYGYWGDISSIVEHQYIMSNLDGSVLRVPIEEVFQGVNEYDDMVEEYGSAVPVAVEFESETFKTQQGESYLMDDASRPFFDPESEGPYELSESPSGSEVSYGAERVFGIMPHYNTWKMELYLDDLVPVDKDGLGDFCASVAERLNRLAGKVRNSERPLYDERRKDYNTKEGFEDLAFDLEDFAIDFEAILDTRPDYQYDDVDMNMANDILDRMYDWGDSFKTMVIDTSGPNPLNNDFTALWYDRGNYPSLSAEDERNCGCGQDPCITYGAESEQKMKRRVRTISGKPHTPRKLVKDQAITPEEAAKRVKLEAEGHDNVLIIGTVDGNPSAMYYSTAPGRNVDEFGFQTGRILVGTEDELTDELSRISRMPGHYTRMEQAGKNWMQNVATSSRFDSEMTGQDMYYTREEAMVRAQELGCHDVHTHEMDGRTVYMPCYTHAKYEEMRYGDMGRDVYGAERKKGKKDEVVVDSREESGITTETRQYKETTYDEDKMREKIPRKYRDAIDSDDAWVAFAAGILGVGIGASLERVNIIPRLFAWLGLD